MIKQTKKVNCILTKPLRGKGGIGDVVSVKKGYARYLERFDKAVRATKDVLSNLEDNKLKWAVVESKNQKIAEDVLQKLKKFEKITLTRRVSHADTLYSAVRHDDIINFFGQHSITLTKENIKIDRVIKTLGDHLVILNIYGNLEHNLTIEVIKEG